ncbi:type I DNA topoisomerase (plasmid) [Xanthomonas campestris pv. campestris]|uniref:type I DNA topoisomerase n=1 Tax=Xanthomonas TaxID=338 RepID=UPI000CEF58B2|nr:type I DNA topoisomerase [Xanthomonas arboricola]PPU05590.1 DNA topoisomerase I [Xanthomonas arboricola]WDJ74926.1 type I DNA topoisomerase [Xanthomonas campestris pv. campestris]
MTKLVVLESPNKTAKVESLLGPGWRVVASKGHIRDLPPRELGVDESSFALQYEMTDRSRAVVAALKSLAASSEKVYLATDPDREGEAIAWHLKDALGLKDSQYTRITFNSIDAGAVKAALRAQRPIDMELVHAQEARRALDRLVGYKVSPILWDSLGSGSSAGRVQSPALRLVYDRETAITKFVPTNHFGAKLTFDGGRWCAEWDTSAELQAGQAYVLERALADAAASCGALEVISSEAKSVQESPPPPFNSAALMKAAGPKLGLSPERVGQLTQSLFEGQKDDDTGHITYHRTDSLNLSADAIADIRRLAASRGWPVPDQPRKFKEKDGAQQGHEAIRPTHLDVVDVGASEEERSLYRLIWERAVASQLAPAQYRVTTLVLRGAAGGKTFDFKATGRVLINPGWRVLSAAADDDDSQNDSVHCGVVPAAPTGVQLRPDQGEVLAKSTRAPARFTKSSLVEEMERLGIGRPSTYAAISAGITSKGYVTEKSRQLFMTALGTSLIETLIAGDFSFVEYGFTRSLEERLDAIAKGNDSYYNVVHDAYKDLVSDIGRVSASGTLKPRFPCPKCGASMRRVQVKSGVFWSCSTYRSSGCDAVMDDAAGEPVARKSHPCPVCGNPMYRRKGEHGHYWKCSGHMDGCRETLPDAKGKPGKRPAHSEHACAKCGKPLIRRAKAATKAKKGYDFFGCSGFPGCDATYGVSNGKPVPSRES